MGINTEKYTIFLAHIFVIPVVEHTGWNEKLLNRSSTWVRSNDPLHNGGHLRKTKCGHEVTIVKVMVL